MNEYKWCGVLIWQLGQVTRRLDTTMADVEMKTQDENNKDGQKTEQTKPSQTPLAEIKANSALIDKAVSTIEPRFTQRVLRSLTASRKRADASTLRNAIEEIYPNGTCYSMQVSRS